MVDLVLPILFISTSYSDGIILNVLVKVTNNHKEVKYMVPLHELSNELINTIYEKAQNNIGRDDFFPFTLKSKEGLRKNIAFVPSTNSSFTSWQPGTYTFEVYLQVEGNKHLKKYTDFEHTIDTQTVNDLIQQSYYLIHRKADLSIIEQFKST
ncbi:MAG TPA: hypothetical protein V6D12_21910 [Candidatus Obscuribacterales bacterium]